MKLIPTRDLPRGAKIKADIKIGDEEIKDAILTYDGMDGMYGRFRYKDTIIPAYGNHKKMKDGTYVFA